MTYTTIECSAPGEIYSLFETGPNLTVHLAGRAPGGGTGPCLCGFDRHMRDDAGRHMIGFSVGGGLKGPGVAHAVCRRCAELAGGERVAGTHSDLFENVLRPLRDRQGDVWELGFDGLMHSRETARFSREHVERKWGPLETVDDAESRARE